MIHDVHNICYLNEAIILTYCVRSSNVKTYQLISKNANNCPEIFNMASSIYSLMNWMPNQPN